MPDPDVPAADGLLADPIVEDAVRLAAYEQALTAVEHVLQPSLLAFLADDGTAPG